MRRALPLSAIIAVEGKNKTLPKNRNRNDKSNRVELSREKYHVMISNIANRLAAIECETRTNETTENRIYSHLY